MERTAYPYSHVCATRGAVTGSPKAEPKLSRSRLKSISTNGSNRPNSQTWHRLANGGIGGESKVQN